MKVIGDQKQPLIGVSMLADYVKIPRSCSCRTNANFWFTNTIGHRGFVQKQVTVLPPKSNENRMFPRKKTIAWDPLCPIDLVTSGSLF